MPLYYFQFDLLWKIKAAKLSAEYFFKLRITNPLEWRVFLLCAVDVLSLHDDYTEK